MGVITIELSRHAVERFRERVRPALAYEMAEEELGRLATVGDIVVDPPDWFALRQRRHAPCYLVIGDLVLPLVPLPGDGTVLLATTCIARGGLSEYARARRKAGRTRRPGRLLAPGRRAGAAARTNRP